MNLNLIKTKKIKSNWFGIICLSNIFYNKNKNNSGVSDENIGINSVSNKFSFFIFSN